MGIVNRNIKMLRRATENDRLIIFVGAGVSMNSGLPSWNNLIKQFAASLGIKTNEHMTSDDYLKIAQMFYNERGRKEYYDDILDQFNKEMEPNLIHYKLLSLRPKHIITTNYDDLIEKAISSSSLIYDLVSEDKDLAYANSNRLLIKMHGDLLRKNIVLKEEDYLLYSRNFTLIETFIKALFVNHTILFIGYSLQDINLKNIIMWLKTVLGEDYQNAYILDANDGNINLVEKNYFKGFGVNIISVADLPDGFKIRKVNELSDIRGKNTVRCIDYICEYESFAEDAFSFYFDKIKLLSEFKRIRLKDIFDSMGLTLSYSIKGSKCIFNKLDKDANTLYDILSLSIKDKEEKDNAAIFVDVFGKTGITFYDFSEFDRSTGEKKERVLEISATNEELKLLNELKFNNYIGIETMAKQNYKQIFEYNNRYFNELLRAYANYILKRYVSAYEILNELSKKAFQSKDYVVFYISEFNKLHLVKYLKVVKSPFGNNLGEEAYVEHIDQIINKKKNRESSDELLEIFYSMPKINRDAVSFLNDILFNNEYLYTKIIDADKIKEKIDKELETNFIGSNAYDSSSIPELKRQVREFWDSLHNFFLMINEYSEINNYYLRYVEILLRTYTKKEVRNESDEFGLFKEFEKNTLAEYEFDSFDIYLMVNELKHKELKSTIEKLEIEFVKIKGPDIIISGMIHNLLISYNSIDNKKMLKNSVLNMLTIIGIMKIEKAEIIVESFKEFTNFISNNYVDLEIYREIAIVLLNQKEVLRKLEDFEWLKKFLVAFVEKINNPQYNNVNDGWELTSLNNSSLISVISALFNEFDCNLYDQENIFKKTLQKCQHGELKKYSALLMNHLFLKVYKLFGEEFKKILLDWFTQELENEFKPNLYFLMLQYEAIEPSERYESILKREIDVRILNKNTNKVISFPDPLDSMIEKVCILLLNGKIVNRDIFREYIDKSNLLYFLLNSKEFNYDNFSLDWISKYGKGIIDIISDDKIIFQEVKNLFISIMKKGNLDKQMIKAYFFYFE